MSIPAHKVIGDVGKPSQLSFDRYPYMKHSTADDGTWDKTLGDYIARKSKHDALTAVNNEKKMTFNEWAKLNNLYAYYTIKEINLLLLGWTAAKEN